MYLEKTKIEVKHLWERSKAFMLSQLREKRVATDADKTANP